ncbi:hypothetical protein LINPERHAP2_LOCUS42176 [Linum perenne]
MEEVNGIRWTAAWIIPLMQMWCLGTQKEKKNVKVAGHLENPMGGTSIYDGWTPSLIHYAKPGKSAPTILIDKNQQKKVAVQNERVSLYIPPGKRRAEGKSSVCSSKTAGRGFSSQARPPIGKTQSLPTKRKLLFRNKGKEKLTEVFKRFPANKGIPTKGIVIQEPGSRDALPLSSSSCSGWKSRSVPPPSELAEEDEEMEEDSPQRFAAAVSAPVLIQASESESVNQSLQEASLEDVGWLRPVIGRWADVVDSDEEDQYAEQGLGEKEVVVVPREESGEEDWSEDEGAADK